MRFQAGGVLCQHGSGGINFPVYRGVSRQYGYGLGSMFKTALRTVMPILKPVAKAGLQSIKHVAKDQGINALRDIMQGQNIKQVLKSRGKSALKSLGKSALDHLASGGIKSNQKRRKNQSKTNRRTVHNKFQKGRGRKNSLNRAISRKYSNLKFSPDIFS